MLRAGSRSDSVLRVAAALFLALMQAPTATLAQAEAADEAAPPEPLADTDAATGPAGAGNDAGSTETDTDPDSDAEAEDGGASTADAAEGDAALETVLAEGEELYLANCRQCHGSTGRSGVPLAGNHRLEDPSHVLQVIITGPRYMPAFGGFLSDEEIATVATFVRNSWGNEYGIVTTEDVAEAR